jgi:hypothetical protein
MKETCGTVTRSALRFGAIFLPASIIALIVLFVGIAIIHTSLVLGVAVVIVGFGALMIVGAYQGAAGAFLRLILYRYATGQSVPNLGVNVSNVFPRTLP